MTLASISVNSQALQLSLRPETLPNTTWVFTPAQDQYALAEISPDLDY